MDNLEIEYFPPGLELATWQLANFIANAEPVYKLLSIDRSGYYDGDRLKSRKLYCRTRFDAWKVPIVLFRRWKDEAEAQKSIMQSALGRCIHL